MKKVFLVISVFVMGMFLMSCGPTREHSNNMTEQATIISSIYSPSQHETHVGTTMMRDLNNPLGGVDMNGDHGIVVGKVNGQTVQISESTIPEKFGIVFQCQHGTFTIEGSAQKYKILYDKLKDHVKDTVNVIYQEIYDVTYEKQNGKQVETKRVLVDLDFIDAQLLK